MNMASVGKRLPHSSVSVVIPAYNAQKFIGAALASAVAQTLPPHEIIVVDDGSTDNTGAVVSGFAPTGPIPLRLLQQSNQGVSVARNTGIDAASGEFIAFLDADDVWLPDKLHAQTALLQANPELEFVLCHMQTVLAPGMAWPAHLNREYYDTAPPLYTPSALVVRRALFDVIGGFDPTYRVSEDTDWFLRARDRGVQMAVVPQILVRKLIHGGNLSRQVEESRRSIFRGLRASVKRRQAQETGSGEQGPGQQGPGQQSDGRQTPQTAPDIVSQTPDSHTPAPISVIIPVYNGARYIGETIRSILAQTLAPQAIFVVDDGSTDDTRAVVEQLIAETSAGSAPAPKIHYLYQTNRGAAAATNRGVEAAPTEFLAFLDADDLWEPHKLARQMAALREDPKVEAVFGHIRQFYSSELQPHIREQMRFGQEVVAGFCVDALLIRQAALHRIGPFDATLKAYFMDWFARGQAAGLRYRLLEDVVVMRRIHGDNLTVRARNEVQSDYFRILKANLERRRSTKS